MEFAKSFVCGVLAAFSVTACAVAGDFTVEISGTQFQVWTGYRVAAADATGTLPEGSLGFWGNDSAVYPADAPDPTPENGIAFVRVPRSVFGGVLKGAIYVKCRTQESCIPDELAGRSEKLSRKGYRVTADSFAGWQDAVRILSTTEAVREWNPDIDYNTRAEVQ